MLSLFICRLKWYESRITERISYNFLREPDKDLKCVICLDIVNNPLEHEKCGKLLCRECLEKYGHDKPCPHCRTKGAKFHPARKSKPPASKLIASCINCLSMHRQEGSHS